MRRFRIAESRPELRTNTERQPDIRRYQRVRTAEPVRRDTDHGVGLAVDLHRATDKVVAATVAFPEPVARHDYRHVRSRLTFFSVIKPAAKRLHAHHREIILRSQEREAAPHLVIATNAGDSELERRPIDKH